MDRWLYYGNNNVAILRTHVKILPISMPRVNGVNFWKTIEFVGRLPLNCWEKNLKKENSYSIVFLGRVWENNYFRYFYPAQSASLAKKTFKRAYKELTVICNLHHRRPHGGFTSKASDPKPNTALTIKYRKLRHTQFLLLTAKNI